MRLLPVGFTYFENNFSDIGLSDSVRLSLPILSAMLNSKTFIGNSPNVQKKHCSQFIT
jgi:hypothetical protein